MTGEKLRRVFQQLQRVPVKLPLIEEFRLVVPAEAGHPQLALRVIRQHPASKRDNGGIEHVVANTKSEPVEDVSRIRRHGSRHSTGSRAEFQCSQDFVLIKVLQTHRRWQILPALLRVSSLQKKALVCLLRHHRRRRSDPLIGPSVESEGPGLVGGVCLEDEHLAI